MRPAHKKYAKKRRLYKRHVRVSRSLSYGSNKIRTKLTAITSLVAQAAGLTSLGPYSIPVMQPGSVLPNGVSAPTTWTYYAGIYDQYRVDKIRIRYVPTYNVDNYTAAATSQSPGFVVFYDVNSIAGTTSGKSIYQALQYPTCKRFDPFKDRSVTWKIKHALGTVANASGTYNGFTSTQLMGSQVNGILQFTSLSTNADLQVNAVVMGILMVDFYVTFADRNN